MKKSEIIPLKDHELLKPSAAIHIQHKISLRQQQIWNKLFQNAYKKLDEKDEFKISVKDIFSIFSYETNDVESLKKNLKSLVETAVEFNVFNKEKKKWGVFPLVGWAEIEDGICSYGYAKPLQKLLHNREMYTKVNLLTQQKFSSKYSFFIYELCLDYKNINHSQEMELDRLRLFLGIEKEQYPAFKDLNRYVLLPAIKEINEKTELLVEVERKKLGRKVVAITLNISRKKNYQEICIQKSLLPIEEDIFQIGERQEIYAKIKDLCKSLSANQINKIINSHTVEKLEIALKYTKEKATENPSFYFSTILKNENFGEEEIQARQKREENLKKRKEIFLKKEEEEKQEQIKKQKISDFIEKNPKIFEKILQEQREVVKNHKFSSGKNAAETLAKSQARGEISKLI